MKLDLKRIKQLPSILKEFNWELILHYDEALLDFCNTSDEEKDVLKLADQFATRCRIDKKENKQIISIDYLLPTKDGAFLAKGINQFVTSAILDIIQIDVYTESHMIEFSYYCHLKKQLPDWHITFGTKPDALILTVDYEISSVNIG